MNSSSNLYLLSPDVLRNDLKISGFSPKHRLSAKLKADAFSSTTFGHTSIVVFSATAVVYHRKCQEWRNSRNVSNVDRAVTAARQSAQEVLASGLLLEWWSCRSRVQVSAGDKSLNASMDMATRRREVVFFQSGDITMCQWPQIANPQAQGTTLCAQSHYAILYNAQPSSSLSYS